MYTIRINKAPASNYHLSQNYIDHGTAQTNIYHTTVNIFNISLYDYSSTTQCHSGSYSHSPVQHFTSQLNDHLSFDSSGKASRAGVKFNIVVCLVNCLLALNRESVP